MAGPVTAIAPETQGEAVEPTSAAWPSSRQAYLALTIIIIATFLNFFDMTIFGLMAQQVKQDFGLDDEMLGFLGGPANVIFYVIVGIPLARLVDIFPRKYVLSAGMGMISIVTALGGVAQGFWQFVGTRVFSGAGGSAHGPGAYSMIADSFPPEKLPRAFALLQLGFIGGTTLGNLFGGQWVYTASQWQPTQWNGLTIFGWQWLLLYLAIPSVLAAIAFLMLKEPPRRLPHDPEVLAAMQADGLWAKFKRLIGVEAFKEVWRRRQVYLPLFIALALSSIEMGGLQFWRTPFVVRTYGWNEAQIGAISGLLFLPASLAGLFLGAFMVERMGRRYKDANVRASAILATISAITTTCAFLMPSPYMAFGLFTISMICGMAAAVPQNSAVQRIARADMRGQITAIYLFMMTFFMATGSYVIGVVSVRVFGREEDLWKALALTAGILLSLAALAMWRAVKPYREEMERLEAVGD